MLARFCLGLVLGFLMVSCGDLSTQQHPSDILVKGGTPVAASHAFSKFVVGISHDDYLASGQTFCSGTLIDEAVVLTAAHCVTSGTFLHFPVEEFRVVQGVAARTARKFQVRSLAWHRSYDSRGTIDPEGTTPPNDLAVLLIDALDDPTLPEVDFLPVEEGDGLVIAGWGTTNGRQGTGTLRTVGTTVTSIEHDRWRFGTGDEEANNAQGACGGDSGGPIFASDGDGYHLRGVLSIGTVSSNGYCRAWNGWTDISHYEDWVGSAVEQIRLVSPGAHRF